MQTSNQTKKEDGYRSSVDHVQSILKKEYPEFTGKKIIERGPLTINRNMLHFHIGCSKYVFVLDLKNDLHYMMSHPKSYKQIAKFLKQKSGSVINKENADQRGFSKKKTKAEWRKDRF